jgi:hypothetical protein
MPCGRAVEKTFHGGSDERLGGFAVERKGPNLNRHKRLKSTVGARSSA